MSIHLITGQGTTDHITSADTGSLNAGIVGTGRYVLNRGNKFAYEIVSNNLIKIKDGDLLNQGRHINIAVNDYEECAIENGLQSVKRNDLIVLRYTKNAETEIEIASVVVIKGVSGDTAVNPSYIYGDILNGDLVDDFPLYRVKLNGLNIEGVDKLFTTNKTLDEVNTKLTAESNKVGLLANLMTTIKTSIVDAINSLVTKLGTTDISAIADGTVSGGISAINTNLYVTRILLNETYGIWLEYNKFTFRISIQKIWQVFVANTPVNILDLSTYGITINKNIRKKVNLNSGIGTISTSGSLLRLSTDSAKVLGEWLYIDETFMI